MGSFSLVGALEFRHFVQGLQPHASSSSLAAFDSPGVPYAGGRYSRPLSRGRTPASRGSVIEHDPWDAALRDVPLDARRSPELFLSHSRARVAESPEPTSAHAADGEVGSRLPSMQRHCASIDDTGMTSPPKTRLQRVTHVLRRTYEILFPTLHHFRDKSLASKLASLFAAPAVLALTLTLPVVVTPFGHAGAPPDMLAQHTSGDLDSGLIDFDESAGEERAVAAEEEVVEELHDHLRFNRWLMATQCVLAPMFCCKVLFGSSV
jgi:sodium/potassium/calcium exchanger 6